MTRQIILSVFLTSGSNQVGVNQFQSQNGKLFYRNVQICNARQGSSIFYQLSSSSLSLEFCGNIWQASYYLNIRKTDSIYILMIALWYVRIVLLILNLHGDSCISQVQLKKHNNSINTTQVAIIAENRVNFRRKGGVRQK